MGRIHLIVRALSTLALILTVSNVNGQIEQEYINTGGISSFSMTYSVGEIFVIEEEVPLDETLNEDNYIPVVAVPNPTNATVRLEFALPLGSYEVLIHDVSGRWIYTQDITDHEVEFSSFTNGIYFIVSPTNEFKTIKILKQ